MFYCLLSVWALLHSLMVVLFRIWLSLDSRIIPHFSPSLISSLVKSYPENTIGGGGVHGIAGDGASVNFFLDNQGFISEVLKTTALRPTG